MFCPIRVLRERLGLSAQQFAARLGVSRRLVAQAELGAVARPVRLWKALKEAVLPAADLATEYEAWLRQALHRRSEGA